MRYRNPHLVYFTLLWDFGCTSCLHLWFHIHTCIGKTMSLDICDHIHVCQLNKTSALSSVNVWKTPCLYCWSEESLFIQPLYLCIWTPLHLHLATSEMWSWSGARGILIKLSLCYSIVYYYNSALAVLTGRSTVSGFELARFSSLSRKLSFTFHRILAISCVAKK